MSIDPGHVRARRELVKVVPRLLELAASALRTGDTVLDRNQWYTTYLNPFELLGLDERTNSFDIDVGEIRKRKRSLLHEIALTEGHLSWLPGLIVERSRAITVLDELNHPRLRKHHALVFADKGLLAFLSRGDHEHFLVDPETSSLDLINEIDRNAEFREWLSSLFVSQYDRVLATAIQQRKLPVIECLLDGRRWVTPSREDDCFECARREVAKLMEPLTEARREVAIRKPSFASVEQLIGRSDMVPIINLLPTYFERQKNAAVEELRDIAVACFNTYHDSDLSNEILELTRMFQFKSAKLNQLLNKDFERIHDLIRQERKQEVHLKRGKADWGITKDGVQRGDLVIRSTDVVGVKWGVQKTRKAGLSTGYFVRFRGTSGRTVRFGWTVLDDWGDGSGAPIGVERSHEVFRHMVQASFEYVLPHVLERIQVKMDRGEPVKIGPYVLTTEGVEVLTRGWMSWSRRQVPWSRVAVQIKHGVVNVIDRQRKRVMGSCNIHETENVMVLNPLAEKYGQVGEKE